MKSKLFVIAVLLTLSSLSSASEIFNVVLKKDGYNRLVFPVAFKDLILNVPSDQVETVSLNDGLALIVRPLEDGEFSLVINLVNGDAFTLLVDPSDELEGPAVWRYQHASDIEDKNIDALYGTSSDKYKWIKSAFTAAHLSYYSREYRMPGMSRDDDITSRVFTVNNEETGAVSELRLVGVSKWRGMDRVLSVYQAQSDSEISIESYDFYTPTTVAVAIESDVVSSSISPYIIILEQDSTNGEH